MQNSSAENGVMCSYDHHNSHHHREFQNNSQRLSPDITRITFYSGQFSSEEEVKSENNHHHNHSHHNQCIIPPGGVGGNNILEEEDQNKELEMKYHHNLIHLSPIADVPLGFYHYFEGENGELRILCKVCGYISNKKSNFKRHFTNMHFVHEDDKQQECCGIRFPTKGEKFHHVKTVHKTGYKCVICLKVFDRPALLQRHLAKHTGKKPYKCSLCPYQTPNKANAKRHIEKRHSDVPEGSILFVTDDGEQIQMEVVTKTEKDNKEQGSPGSTTSSAASAEVVKAEPTATATTFLDELIGPMMPMFKYPHPRAPSATVTSAPGSELEERRRQIGHSIESIMNRDGSVLPEGNQNKNPENLSSSAATVAATATSSAASSSSSVIPLIGYNHNQQHPQQPMNELVRRAHSSLDWSQTSTSSAHHSFRAQHQLQPYFHFGIGNGTPGATAASSLPSLSRPFPPILFKQCPHGCWHHIGDFPVNHVTSDFLYSFNNSSPDLRSSSENSSSSPNSNASLQRDGDGDEQEDDDSDDVIDVVGVNSDEEEEGNGSGSGAKNNLNYICEGLGNCSTAELHLHRPHQVNVSVKKEGEPENAGVGGGSGGPPVVSPTLDDRNEGSSNDDGFVGGSESDPYIPKKLRMSKSFMMNKVQMF